MPSFEVSKIFVGLQLLAFICWLAEYNPTRCPAYFITTYDIGKSNDINPHLEISARVIHDFEPGFPELHMTLCIYYLFSQTGAA